MSSADRQAIRTVYVSRHVKVADEPVIMARKDTTISALAGPVVGVLVALNDKSEETVFKQNLQKQGVRLDEMVAQSFSNEISRRNVFKVVTNEKQADAVVNLEVQMYGYGHTANAFSNKYYAQIGCKATMVSSGREVWMGSNIANGVYGGLTKFSVKQLYTQPGMLRGRMQEASDAVAKRVVNDLAPKK